MINYSTFGEISFFQKVRSLDFYLLISIILVGAISFVVMYSTDISDKNFYHTYNHILRFSIFFILMLSLSFINIKYYFSLSFFFYFIVLILLLGATFFGTKVSGSQRWINLYFINLQPSELMKIAIIVFLARYYHRVQPDAVNTLKKFIIPFIILLIPILLVLSQPDLGTSVLIALSGIAVIWLAGINVKYIIYSFLSLVILFPFVISILKPYQKLRILTFINPDRDPLGAGYQIIQSKIAVGSGGLFGKGFLKGTQGYLDFLPEKHTDFIFTLFSEQFGFIGSVLLLFLYAFIIIRILIIGSNSRNYFGKFFCYGFAISIFFYISVNMLMVLGMLPIVGSPLPIMSYGGSSMLSMMIALGIVMSTRIYSREIIN
tara:strand:+ start:697 stop:1821 length:1125 start_codon:yes stop_codon:yes gene_type:complete